MSPYGFGDLIANPHHGVERTHRLLEDHGHARAAQPTHGFAGNSEQVVGNRGGVASSWALGEENFARYPSLRRKQAHDGQGGDRFAGAGFTDKPQNFTGGDAEAEGADRGKRLSGNSRPRLSRRPQDGSGKRNA